MDIYNLYQATSWSKRGIGGRLYTVSVSMSDYMYIRGVDCPVAVHNGLMTVYTELINLLRSLITAVEWTE